MNNIVITIDGPSGSGKGTTAHGVAKLLGIHHIDSGSIYRTLGYFLNSKKIDNSDGPKIIQALPEFLMSYTKEGQVLLNNLLVEKEIRSRENSKIVFGYARNPIIRDKATSIQRELLKNGGVLDGRDAGSIVAPHADLKIYLDCDVDERTRRRAKQHKITDQKEIAELKQEILDRDASDAKNSGSLEILPDSILVNTSGLTVEQQVDKVYQLALKKMK